MSWSLMLPASAVSGASSTSSGSSRLDIPVMVPPDIARLNFCYSGTFRAGQFGRPLGLTGGRCDATRGGRQGGSPGASVLGALSTFIRSNGPAAPGGMDGDL